MQGTLGPSGCSIQPSHPPHPHKKKKKKTLGGTGTPLKLRKLLATLFIDGDSDLFLLIVIKVTCVPRAFKLWYEGSFHLPLVDGDPVSCGKPLVVLDVIDPILEVPKALGEVHLQ